MNRARRDFCAAGRSVSILVLLELLVLLFLRLFAAILLRSQSHEQPELLSDLDRSWADTAAGANRDSTIERG